jgi:hypothetical protein
LGAADSVLSAASRKFSPAPRSFSPQLGVGKASDGIYIQDSSGATKSGNANVSEIHNQVLMMLGHEIFDPEIGKRVLVDHAFIVVPSGSLIT